MSMRFQMKKMIKKLVTLLLLLIFSYLLIMKVKLNYELEKANNRLHDYNSQNIKLSYGNISYAEIGKGEVILSSHGLFGGYDQGIENLKSLSKYMRIIAPSRFGYLKSDVKGKGTPKDQSKAYVELLDKLGIDKVYVMGASAGGTSAIRFALDYPERCKGLILYCSAMPETKKSENVNLKQGPPEILVNNYMMYITSPFFKATMGMEQEVIKTMLPIDLRKLGVKIDSEITNPDMSLNFNDYKIENLQIPTLILQAKDDKIVDYNKTLAAAGRFPNLTLKIFENGGHMIKGHGEEIDKYVLEFINSNSHK